MSDWFTADPASLVAVALSAVAVYALVLLYTRLAGLRSFAKMSSFDFAMTVAIGSMLAASVLNASVPLPQAAVGIGMVFGLQIAVGWARRRWSAFQHLVDNEPLLLMNGSEMLEDHMKSVQVTEDDLWSKLREANVLDVSHIRAVVMETTGDISVLHGDPDGTPLQPRILTGVRGADAVTASEVDASPDRPGVQ